MLYVFSVTLILLYGIYAEYSGTANRVLIYYSYGMVSWNHAAEICENEGMTLVTIGSEDVITAMQTFKATGEPWAVNFKEFWTGLHNVGAPSTVQYVWHICTALGSYQPWSDDGNQDTERCIRGESNLGPLQSWETKHCHKKNGHALCEKIEGDCHFKTYSGMKPDVTVTENHPYLDASNVDKCESYCLNWSMNVSTKECWGFSWNSEIPSCVLYLTANFSSLFASKIQASNPNTTLYIKLCFKAILNNSDMGASKYTSNPKDKYPWMGCNGSTSHSVTTSTYRLGSFKGNATSASTTSETPSTNLSYATNTSVNPESTSPIVTMTTDSTSHADTGSIHQIIIDTNNSTSQTSTATNNSTGQTSTTTNNSTGQTSTAYTDSHVSPSTTGTNSSTPSNSYVTGSAAHFTVKDRDSTSTNTVPNLETIISETVLSGTRNMDSPHHTTATETNAAPHTTTVNTETLPSLDPVNTVLVTGTPITTTTDVEPRRCSCNCRSGKLNLTAQEKRAFIDYILGDLTIDKTKVSSNRRKYESVADYRMSAQRLGVMGIVFLCLLFGSLIMVDIRTLVQNGLGRGI